MKITSTFITGELKPFQVQPGERIKFHSKKSKRGEDMWFSGKYNHIRNMNMHSMIFRSCGHVCKEDNKKIIAMMKKGKTEILTDGYKYYTFYSDWSIIENIQMFIVLNKYITITVDENGEM